MYINSIQQIQHVSFEYVYNCQISRHGCAFGSAVVGAAAATMLFRSLSVSLFLFFHHSRWFVHVYTFLPTNSYLASEMFTSPQVNVCSSKCMEFPHRWLDSHNAQSFFFYVMLFFRFSFSSLFCLFFFYFTISSTKANREQTSRNADAIPT